MARPPYQPTDNNRRQVESWSGVGITQEQMAALLEIDVDTLVKYYRKEIDQGKAKACASIGSSFYQKAKDGDTAAMIWWTKSQMGWKGEKVIDHTSSDGSMTPKSLDVSKLSTGALKEIMALNDEANKS